MKCAHCHAKKAENKWHPDVCADGKRRTKYLCNFCDLLLNRIVLTFFNDPRAEEKMARYESDER